MRKFSDFKIKHEVKFEGEKVHISRIFNREIIVKDYAIEPSIFGGERLKLQFLLDGVLKITFCGSKVLIDMLDQIPKGEFSTTIIREGQSYIFT